jgi:hypothetical protein
MSSIHHLEQVCHRFSQVSDFMQCSFPLTSLGSFHCQLWCQISHSTDRTVPCQCYHRSVGMFARMPISQSENRSKLTSSTLKAVLAEVSVKISPFSLAKRSPSSWETYLRASKSHLLPMSMMVMSGLPFCLTSSSHLVRWLKVSRLLWLKIWFIITW